MITTKPITIYELFRRGELIAISIDRRGFLAHRIRTSHRIRNSKGQLKAVYSIRAKTVIAGVVCGAAAMEKGGNGNCTMSAHNATNGTGKILIQKTAVHICLGPSVTA